MTTVDKLMRLDRRWIFLFIALAVCAPLVYKFEFPGLEVGPATKNYFKTIEELPEGSRILISADFDPASAPELSPMLEATLRHAFRRKLRVSLMTLWVTGAGLAEQTLKDNVAFCRETYGVDPQYGIDYVYLGWKSGAAAVIIGMGVDVHQIFGYKDNYGKDLATMPLMKDVKVVSDFDLLVCIAAGFPGFPEWVMYAAEKYKLPFLGGCTGVIVPEAYPYMQAGQMNGLLAAMKGAAEYEKTLATPGTATEGMAALSMAHLTIAFFIILANILFILSRTKRTAKEES
ncbi:MAG: hypothetical protein ACYTAF_08750 [Planctomycetota bacterium]|jgi:hypothetical protein